MIHLRQTTRQSKPQRESRWLRLGAAAATGAALHFLGNLETEERRKRRRVSMPDEALNATPIRMPEAAPPAQNPDHIQFQVSPEELASDLEIIYKSLFMMEQKSLCLKSDYNLLPDATLSTLASYFSNPFLSLPSPLNSIILLPSAIYRLESGATEFTLCWASSNCTVLYP